MSCLMFCLNNKVSQGQGVTLNHLNPCPQVAFNHLDNASIEDQGVEIQVTLSSYSTSSIITLSLFYKLRKTFLGYSELRKGCILGFLVPISSRRCSLIQGGQVDLLSLLGHGSSA